MQCPSKVPDVQDKFAEMTSAASEADNAEQRAEKKVQEVEDTEKVLLQNVGNGLELTVDGIVEYKELVQKAFEEAKEAKKSYQMYGAMCLNILGLGRKLPLVKFEKKIKSDVKVKCKFCENEYTQFVILSDHMLRAHDQEFNDLFKGISTREETSESEKSVKVKSGKGDKESQKKAPVNYVCEICEKVYNNKPARDNHQTLCSGIEDKPKCPDYGKIFESKSGYKKHKKLHKEGK